MPEPEAMSWEEAAYYEVGYAAVGNPFEETNPAHDWLDRALRAIALARQDKERTVKAEASLALADKLAYAVEKYCCNVGAVKGYKLREPMADACLAYEESRK